MPNVLRTGLSTLTVINAAEGCGERSNHDSSCGQASEWAPCLLPFQSANYSSSISRLHLAVPLFSVLRYNVAVKAMGSNFSSPTSSFG